MIIVKSRPAIANRAMLLAKIHGLRGQDAGQFATFVLRHKSILNRHISAEAERLCV